jgi:hypothetical protein
MACQPVIPSSTSWIDPPSYDRRFAIRYEKTQRNDAAVVAIGCALLWLRL